MRDDMGNSVELGPVELGLLGAQRARLAGRLEPPWWYVVTVAFGWAVAFAVPIGSHDITGAGLAGSLLVIVVFLLAQYVLARVSGVDVGFATWQYPSGRVWTVAMAVVILAADAAETVLLDRGLFAVAVMVGVLATAAGTACWQGHLRGIRSDLAAGRATT